MGRIRLFLSSGGIEYLVKFDFLVVVLMLLMLSMSRKICIDVIHVVCAHTNDTFSGYSLALNEDLQLDAYRQIIWEHVQGLSCGINVNMGLDNVITSPHRRTQAQTAFSQPILKRQHSRVEELGSCSTLVQRHRFLLTALILLAFLCTVYLYFAVTLRAGDCSGLTGARKASCHLQQAKASVAKGKLKFF